MNALSTKLHRNESAPSYPVNGGILVNVEHPGIVQNVNRAISSLGGLLELSEVIKVFCGLFHVRH